MLQTPNQNYETLVLRTGLNIKSNSKFYDVTISTDAICRKASFPRGAGTVLISRCNSNEEEFASLCYPKCADGYENVLGNICRKVGCGGLDGAVDIGVSCRKPAGYGRGWGYAMWNQAWCERREGRPCERYGAMYYPVCAPNYRAFGSNICTPVCPSGWTDDGAHCQKPSYGRGVGVSRLGCPEGKENQDALCYVPCPPNTYGVGPVCWSTCRGKTSFACGLFCTETKEKCDSVTVKIIDSGAQVALAAVTQDALGAFMNFVEGTGTIVSPDECK